MKTYTIPYGDGAVSVSLNEEDVLEELHGHATPALTDIKKTLFESLENPIDSEPLKARVKTGDRVAVIVSDMSRFWMRQDMVIPHLIDYLTDQCGIHETDITIVVANGTHIGGDEKELRTLVTDGVYDRIRVENHDCKAKDLVYLGTTPHETPVYINKTVAESDCVVALGAVTHHVMAGYGGGRKSILPGVSGEETIFHNHAYSLDPRALRSNPEIGNGKVEGNPLHEDMCEAASLVKNLFVVNLVLNADMKHSAIYSGHFLTSWQKACEEIEKIYSVPVKEKADVIVAGCGGFPKDISLYQGTKSIDNIESGLKLGGTLILCIEARDGGGPEEYFDWSKNLVDGTIEQRLRKAFTVAGYIFFLNCEQAQRYHIYMYSTIDPELVKPMGIKAYSDMDALLKDADIEGKTTYVIPNAATVIPRVMK